MSRLPRFKPDRKMLWLMKKELKSLFRSRWLIFGLIISPVFAWSFEGAFLSFVVAQTTSEPQDVFITLEDDGVLGSNLYSQIESNMSRPELLINKLINITREDGNNMVNNRTLSVWVIIPENFTQDLQANNESTMVIWVNTGNLRASAAAQRVDAFAKGIIKIVVQDLTVRWFTISPEATYGHSLAVFLVMIVSVLAPSPYVGKSFAGEREQHTLEALLVVPMSRVSILVSKLIAGLILTLVYSIFTVIGIGIYNISILLRAGTLPPATMDFYINLYTINPVTIPLIFFCQMLILLMAISIGIVISSLARDQAEAESINNLILLVPTMVIGILGFTGSILQYGGLFGFIVLAIPFTHAVLFLNGVLSGTATAASLLGNVGYMLGFTIIFLIIGAKLFEREAIIA